MPGLEITFLYGGLWWLALLFIITLGGLTYYSYKYITVIDTREKWMLTAVRAFTILLLCLSLVQMIFLFTSRRKQRNHVVILVDSSASMSLPVSAALPTRFDTIHALVQDKLLPALSDTFDIDAYAFDTETTFFDPSKEREWEGLQPDGSGTDHGGALRRVSQQAGFQPVAGIILLSDGQHTAFGTPADAARALGAQDIPILAYTFSTTALHDIAVSELSVPDEVPVDRQTMLEAQLYQEGFGGQSVRVQWFENGRLIGAQNVQLTGTAQRIRMPWTPSSRGVKKIEIRVSSFPGEITALNNELSHYTRVVKNHFKILMVWGAPSWDYKFLYRCYDDERTFALTTVINRKPGDILALQEIGSALNDFDLVILGDISADLLGNNFARALAGFVGGRGGALLMIGGSRSFNLGNYQNSPLAEVLPIEWGSGGMFDLPFTPELTPAGLSHPVMRLNDDQHFNQQLWRNLPPLEKANVVTRLKRGTEVLAVHPSRRDMAIVAVSRYGIGKVGIFTGVQSWKWDFVSRGYGGSGEHYRRFWRQFARYLMSTKTQQINVNTDRYHYTGGETVRIYASLYTSDFSPVTTAQPVAQILRQSGAGYETVDTVPLANSRVNPDQYIGAWAAEENGEYRVRLTVAHPQVSGSAESPFLIRFPHAEYRRLGVNTDMLGQLTRASGGRLFNDDNVSHISQWLKPKQRRIRRTTAIELWNSWPFFILVVLLLAAEWIWRKHRGLL